MKARLENCCMRQPSPMKGNMSMHCSKMMVACFLVCLAFAAICVFLFFVKP
jgi:hypothetical protein